MSETEGSIILLSRGPSRTQIGIRLFCRGKLRGGNVFSGRQLRRCSSGGSVTFFASDVLVCGFIRFQAGMMATLEQTAEEQSRYA